ncbi:Hypothetical protein CINCED_3A013858 [Cinara cedri]|uniref:Uncharacterized protein n=1 Tax=Cinara cedri TaxID=506608 RepID=A0A5E4MH37_9HEMI|nr:Hypothetical protein CINCED_3A013858 [Cinara cedri]
MPLLNFVADDYTELVDWKKCEITEPKMLSMIENEALKRAIYYYFTKSFVQFKYEFVVSSRFLCPNNVTECIDIFPCHTQYAERAV